MKFKASLCQTLDVLNSKRMHPCLRYDFADRASQSSLFSAKTLLSNSSQIFLAAREGNHRQTVDGNNIRSNPKLPLRANIRHV